MATTQTSPQDFATADTQFREMIQGTWNWKTCWAVFGLCAGFIAAILGSIVTVISWFEDPVWHAISLHQVGTTLFVLTLPLLILGAHCLDLIDKDKKALHAFQRDDAGNPQI